MWFSMEVNFEVTLLIIPDFQLKIFYLFLCIMNITTLIKRKPAQNHLEISVHTHYNGYNQKTGKCCWRYGEI